MNDVSQPVSSSNSEIEIKSRGSEEHPGASKATANPPTYFNVLSSKSKIPNTTKSHVSEEGEKCEGVPVIPDLGKPPS